MSLFRGPSTERIVAKNAIVTGSSRRVGKAIAKKLVDKGWKVCIHGRDERLTLEVRREVGANLAVVGDLCDLDTYISFQKVCENVFDGKLGYLINSASTFQPDGSTIEQDWENFSLSLWSAHWAFMSMRSLMPYVSAADGTILNLSDYANSEHWDGFIAHGVAKSAVEAMSEPFYEHKDTSQGVAVIAMRLPTVLPPDGKSQKDLEKAYGKQLDLNTVCEKIESIGSTHKYGTGTCQLDRLGYMEWVH